MVHRSLPYPSINRPAWQQFRAFSTNNHLIMTTSRFASQYERLRADHDKIKAAKPQLIPSITATDITIPVNHVMTGMTKKAMALLMKILGGEATEWNDEKADRLQELTSSIAITIGGLETIRELKQKIIEIHAATGKLKNKRQGSVEHCNDMCLFNLISNDDLKWDMVPCSECGKSNHEVCGRVWNGEMLTANNIKTFRCVQCRGETIASLMTLDKEYIEELEVAETEIMGNMETYECERNELIRDEGRTNESLVAALDALKIKCGVYNRYYYADLVGADARRLTRHENAVKLWELVENEEIRSNGVKLFDAIHDIFKILTTGYQSPAEISEFDRLIESIQVIWSQLNPSETVPLKLHSLMHISESMKREGHGGREIELIEHCHHCLNVLIPRYITITPLNRRLAIVSYIAQFNCYDHWDGHRTTHNHVVYSDGNSDHESMRTVLRKAFSDLDSAIMAYGTSMGKLRRKVEHMLSDTGERKEAKDAETALFHEMRDEDDEDLEFNEEILTDSLLPSMGSLIDRALSNAMTDVKHMAEMTTMRESIQTSTSITHSQPPEVILTGMASQLNQLDDSDHCDQATVPSVVELQRELMSLKAQISGVSSPVANAQSQIPLPPLQIEPFDGSNITLWPSFHSQFQTIIGCRRELSNLEKLNYLRSSLKGDAFKLVQSIPIREDLYDHTLDRLKVAFDRSNHSTALLYQKLMGLRPKSSRIEDLLNCVRDMINLVYHIDDDKNLNSLPLIQQLAGHINSNFIRKIWKMNPLTMMDALTFMDRELREELELRAVESAFSQFNLSMPSHPNQSSSDVRRGNVSTDDKMTKSLQDTSKCAYCGSNHLSSSCSQYKSVDDRSNRISQIKVCRRCLKSGHNFSQCPEKCEKCNGNHHESLCKPSSSSPQSSSNANVIQAAAIGNHSLTQPRLQTVNGVIRDPTHGVATNATVFLDTGSQLSMITQSLSKKLNLTPFDSQVLRLTGVNGSTESDLTDLVQFDLMTNTGIQSVTAIVAKELPVPPMRVDAISQSDITFIKDKSITVPPIDTTNHLVVPEILLGLDVTHSLTKNATSIKLPSGFDLIHSQLGPIIFGSQSQNVNESTEDHEAAVCFGVIIDPGDQEAQAESDDRLDRISRLMFNVDGCSDYEDDDDSLSFDDSFNDDHAHLIPFQLPDYFPP